MFYSPTTLGVRCDLCARRCVIPEGKVGYCNVRRNENAKLLTDIYGYLSLRFIDNIEKKAQYHFNPGSATFSFGTTSCNFRCKFCINHELSNQKKFVAIEKLSPLEIVESALKNDCQGISFTYNEPTIFFEYAYDTAKLAHKNGLYSTIVTNGYMTPEAVNMISPYIDAVTVDFKGSGNSQFYRELCDVHNVQPIFECVKTFRDKKVHVELTNLVMLEHGDSNQELHKLGKWILDNLGPETPLHLLPFRAQCLMEQREQSNTEVNVIKLSNDLRRLGLKYVYNRYERDTNCPSCGEQLISRCGKHVFHLTYNLTSEYACPKCGSKLLIVGKCYSGKEVRASAIDGGTNYYWGYEG